MERSDGEEAHLHSPAPHPPRSARSQSSEKIGALQILSPGCVTEGFFSLLHYRMS